MTATNRPFLPVPLNNLTSQLVKGGDTLDGNTLIQLIGSLGFPIVACIALFWQNIQESQKHENEVNALREALEANTKIINELYVYLKEVRNSA